MLCPDAPALPAMPHPDASDHALRWIFQQHETSLCVDWLQILKKGCKVSAISCDPSISAQNGGSAE
jgi:hypothetical protein